MIAQLTGEIVLLTPLVRGGVECVLDVQGVGYLLIMPQSLDQSIGLERGQSASLATYMHVREGAIELFGFQDAKQKQLFELLIGVSGVGPKVAIALLSIGSADGLVHALAQGDIKYVSSAQGVGKKVAQRLVTELSDKVATWAQVAPVASGAVMKPASGPEQTALAALQQLGFKEREAMYAIEQAMQEQTEELTAQTLIKAALQVAT